MALEPKTVLSANVAKAKTRKTHDLHHYLEKYDPFHHSEDTLLLTAYGYHTLGNPRIGLSSHVDYIDSKMLSDFILNNVTPGRTLFVANGINNHQEFVALCKERLGDILPVPEQNYQREQAKYIGGEYRNWTETPNTQITVAFEGASWTSHHQPALQVAATILGCSKQGFNHRHISSVSHRSLANIVSQHSFVDHAHAINHHFTDSGIFGLQVTGSGSHSRELMDVTVRQLAGLKDHISDEELNRAKNVLKMNIAKDMECPTNRLEEIAKNYTMYGENLTFNRYSEIIDSVTAHQVNEVSFLTFRPYPMLSKVTQQCLFKEAQSISFPLFLMFRDSLDNNKN